MTGSRLEPGSADAPQGAGGVSAADRVWARLEQWADSPQTLAQVAAALFDEPCGTGAGAGVPRGPRLECGTRRAYDQHRYYREPIDDACRKANNERAAARPRRATDPGLARYRKRPECGSHKAYNQHLYWGEPVDEACLKAHREYESERARRQRERQR